MVRRTIFVYVTVYLFDHPFAQMMFHYALTLVTVCYLASSGIYEERRRQYIEVANECMLLLASALI